MHWHMVCGLEGIKSRKGAIKNGKKTQLTIPELGVDVVV